MSSMTRSRAHTQPQHILGLSNQPARRPTRKPGDPEGTQKRQRAHQGVHELANLQTKQQQQKKIQTASRAPSQSQKMLKKYDNPDVTEIHKSVIRR